MLVLTRRAGRARSGGAARARDVYRGVCGIPRGRPVVPLRGAAPLIQNYLDSRKNVGAVRRFADNPIQLQPSLAKNVGFSDRIRRFARNVAPAENVLSRKTEKVNAGYYHASNKRGKFKKLDAERTKHHNTKLFRPIKNFEQETRVPKLIGRSRVSGTADQPVVTTQKTYDVFKLPHVASRPQPFTGTRFGNEMTRFNSRKDPIKNVQTFGKSFRATEVLAPRGSFTAKEFLPGLPERANVNPKVGNRMTY